jgi:Tol biopolymer transport system component
LPLLTHFQSYFRLWQADLVESGSSLVLDSKREVSIEIKAGIKKIIWPDKTNNFIAEINSFGEKSYSYYNSQTGMYTDLPKQVISLGFLPGGEKILYIWQENGKATLNEGNGDATGWKEIAEMWEQNNSISISPDGLNVLYFQTVNSSAINPINLTTPDGKLWRGLVKDGYNTGVLWSPDGQKFLFTKKDSVSLKHQLWNYDVLSGEVKNLGVYTTIEKVTWDKESSNVYVASPDETSPVPQEGVLTTDQVFRVNVQTLEKKEYSLENQKIDGRDLFLNIAGDKLFFKNAQDGFL